MDLDDLGRLDELVVSAQTSQGQSKEQKPIEKSVSKAGGKKKPAALSSIDEESFIEQEMVRRNNLLKEQANAQRAMMGPQSSQLIILPKFCDKKNGRLVIKSAQENQHVRQDHHFQSKQLGVSVVYLETNLSIGSGHLRVYLLQRSHKIKLETTSLRFD
jgi:hypothetical protein